MRSKREQKLITKSTGAQVDSLRKKNPGVAGVEREYECPVVKQDPD